MKLRHLHINSFGHFSEHDIPLSDDGLQVIYGPNEAGKTTLLEFLRGWLFDFPIRTPYDFKRGAEIAGVGTLILSDGRIVELRRRKGNKNKVAVKLDGKHTDLDEIGFQRLLGHANRNLFESVFAFGLDQLAMGEESLKHESLQSALFGGGLGLTASPEDILNSLDERASKLFSPSARSKSTVTALLGDLKELANQVKQNNLRPEEYTQRQQAVVKSEALATDLHQQVDQLRREHSRLDRLNRAWPKWNELQQRIQERRPLTVPAAMPLNARQLFDLAVDRLRKAEEDVSCLEDLIGNSERELATLKLDPQSMSLRAEIRACLELKKSYLDAFHDLPERIRQRDATKQQIDRELSELRPGWSPNDLRAFSIDVATRAEIDRLAKDDQDRTKERTKLQAIRDGIEGSLAEAQADLESLGETRDVSSLAAVLADEAAYVSNQNQREALIRELAKINRLLATRCCKLTPPLAAGSQSPQELPVPRLETIEQFETDFTDCRDQLRAATASLEEDEAEHRRLTEKQGDADESRAVPNLQERDVARQQRDVGWQLIRARHVEGQPVPAEEQAWLSGNNGALVDVYEQSVSDADDIADRIYENADAVARREEMRRQLDAVARRIKQKQSRVMELREQDSDLRSQWLTTWRPCGLEPLAPDAMRRWIDDHLALCETVAKRAECDSDLCQCASRISLFEDRLRSACGSPEANVSELLVTARQVVEQASNDQRRTKDLQTSIKRLEMQLGGCVNKLTAIEERQSLWGVEWISLLRRLHLPVDWNTDLARSVIERLVATRVKLDSLPHEEDRIMAMHARVQEFESKVLPLCESLAPSLARDPPELVVEKLSEQLERAMAAQTKNDRLHEQLTSSLGQLKQVAERREKADAERHSLFVAAEVASEAEFVNVVSRSERIKELDGELERLSREIDLIRASDDREEFEQLLSRVEPGVLGGRQRDVTGQLQLMEQQMRDADGAAAVAKSELARLDGSSEAAVLVDQQSRKRAHLAAEVDRFVPLVLARHLLAEAIRRFERENQPEMIAAVSQLLNQMTAGRYTEFDRMGGEQKGILVRLKDGVERTPDQLSAGTREQLYLAIRLAYVLHYCRQNEPLPIIMDDVLVNFDDDRARRTLSALTSVASKVQVLFFTCHPHMVALAKDVFPSLSPIELPAVS